jgi:RNA polymerase sigma-70 factor (ECF subfamily)
MADSEPRRAAVAAPETEAALVNAARAGNLRAFEDLVRLYEGKIYRLAYNMTQNSADAQDVVQDAFLKAFEHLDGFQGQSRFYTWLVRIAVNEALMRLRKRRPGVISLEAPIETEEDLVPREVADWGPSPEERYEQTELRRILSDAIAQLDPDYRIVFQLRDIEQLSTEETAQALGLSVPAVKSRLLRARLKLRHNLDRYFRRSNQSAV